MIEVKTYDAEGSPGEPISVEEEWFGGRVNARVLRDVILMYEARRRAGTANVRLRSETAGSTRKLWRQKGTGRARVGDARAPQRRGGAAVFGPKPRDYSYSVPKKVRLKALDSALLAKLRDDEVAVSGVEAPEEPRTAHVAGHLERIGVEKGSSCLFVTAGHDGNFWKSARNIPGLEVRTLDQLNAYEVVRPRKVIFARSAFEKLLEQRR